jgi:lipoic acid synthetase
MILGDTCTRNCKYCNVKHGGPNTFDSEEPERVAEAVRKLGLKYAVITSVTRDDLPDGGAEIFAETIKEIKMLCPDCKVEVLIPDFQGNPDALVKVLAARPSVLNHNIETVRRLYPRVRPQADYERSLRLLKRAHDFDPGMPVKSGLMFGLGETPEEIRETLQDLIGAGCSILTLGQYLQPSDSHLPVERFVPPGEFRQWGETALALGFVQVASDPFVRSSYHAKELYQAASSHGG